MAGGGIVAEAASGEGDAGLERFRVALIQTELGPDKRENVDRALALVDQAARRSPQLIVLPENFSFFGTPEQIAAQAEPLEGPTLTRVRESARRHAVHIVAGTVKLRVPGRERLLNSSCLIDPQGEFAAVYHKLHIFNADVGGASYRGSAVEEPGDELFVVDVAGVAVGLSVCYDLRFPELYRILTLRGARVICVPSLFTLHTGRDHWDVLLRARAIENQVFMLAPDICGPYPPRQDWAYGRSLVVDPWGLVIAQLHDVPGVLEAELDLDWQAEVRRRLPALAHRRPQAYRWPEGQP